MNVTTLANPASWLIPSYHPSGVEVNATTVLTSGPVWQAATMISGDIASMPVDVFRMLGGTAGDSIMEQQKNIDQSHPVWKLFNRQMNDRMTSIVGMQTLMHYALITGNGIGFIEFDNMMQPISIKPMRPESTWLYLANAGSGDVLPEYVYITTTRTGRTLALEPWEVFHIIGIGDGQWGLSVAQMGGQNIGNGLAASKYAGYMFGNMATPGGVLENPLQMTSDKIADLRREWSASQRGMDNAQKTAILHDGWTFKPLQYSFNEMQLLDSKKFHVEEVANWFNIPQHKLGSGTDTSKANLEEENDAYQQQTLLPWITKIEKEIWTKLFSNRTKKRGTFEVRLRHDHITKAPLQQRYQSYAIGRQWGWLSVNDIRKMEGFNPVAGGDTYLQPMNMVDVDRADDLIDKQTEPTPTPETAGSPSPAVNGQRQRQITYSEMKPPGSNGHGRN